MNQLPQFEYPDPNMLVGPDTGLDSRRVHTLFLLGCAERGLMKVLTRYHDELIKNGVPEDEARMRALLPDETTA